MPYLRAIAISALVITGLSACASTPDPEKICTAEWIGARSDKAVSSIERKAKPALSKLGKAAQSYAAGKKPNIVQMFSLNNSIKSLTKELESGRGIRDLKTVANTCNDPTIVTSAMTNLMRENGLSQWMIEMVENLPQYRELILKGLSQTPVQPVALYTTPPSQTLHN